MDDAVLNFRFGKDCCNSFRKDGQVIRAGNEDIIYAPFAQAVEHSWAQNLALSFSPTHMPRTSLCQSRLMPIAI